MNALQLAILFHDTYERLAPSFGYETRADTKAFDPDSANGKLMQAVCGEIRAALIPDGWQIVPVDPTPEMMHFGRYGGDSTAPSFGQECEYGVTAWPFVGGHTAGRIYSAMLAAAPSNGAKP